MNNTYDTDVLIIGAGLAGSVLAYQLRQHGLRVTIAERGQLDALDKLCAGALDESVEKLFEGIYGPGSLASIGLHIASQRTSSCLGASIQGDASFATVPRKRLDDVLLRHCPNVWFVGDAAGLITDLGGGIHYAIESAALLADSLAGGEPYEDAMAPTVAEVTGMAHSIELDYLMRCVQITRSGTTHEGTSSPKRPAHI